MLLCYKSENQKVAKLLINDLDDGCNNLFSSKYLDFLNWEKAHNIIINKGHKTLDGQSTITELKKSMNNKRTHFNWDHLKKLRKCL